VANRKPASESTGTASGKHGGCKILLPGVRRPGVVAVSIGAGIALDPLTATLAAHTGRWS